MVSGGGQERDERARASSGQGKRGGGAGTHLGQNSPSHVSSLRSRFWLNFRPCDSATRSRQQTDSKASIHYFRTRFNLSGGIIAVYFMRKSVGFLGVGFTEGILWKTHDMQLATILMQDKKMYPSDSTLVQNPEVLNQPYSQDEKHPQYFANRPYIV